MRTAASAGSEEDADEHRSWARFLAGNDIRRSADVGARGAELGYTSLWTPEGAGLDSFQLCALRWRASADVVAGGIGTGIGVCPIAYRSPIAFAMSAGTLSAQSGGKFALGIGSGGIYREATRRQLGLPRVQR